MKTKMPGTKITSFEELLRQEKLVYHTLWNKPISLGFLLSMQFRCVAKYLKQGQLYTIRNLTATEATNEPYIKHYSTKKYGTSFKISKSMINEKTPFEIWLANFLKLGKK